MIVDKRFENVNSWVSTAVGTSAASLTPTPATNRTSVHLTNTSASQVVYVGYADTVTSEFYLKRLGPTEFFEIQAGPAVPLFAIASAAGATLAVAEVS
ncbi:MAG: hypothetical protein ACOYON_06655 [Fimbriimonas sp.]